LIVLYLITHRLALPAPHWPAQLELIAQAAQSGISLIQIREKDVSAQMLAEFAQQALAVARPHGARILINDRVDVALAVGADGVHLRVDSLSSATVRQITPPHFLIGASAHSLAEAQLAQAGGANFITCGPVYETLSKREYGAPLGLTAFRAIAEAVALPVYALGGIDETNWLEPLQHGAAGIAAIGLWQTPERIVRMAAELSVRCTSASGGFAL
jgi:thiamine-phosphate pyrophosphorylase